METRIYYCCDACSRIDHIEFVKLPDSPEVLRTILPPDWQWIEEGMYCPACKSKITGVDGGDHLC